MPMPMHVRRRGRTNPLIWLLSIICAILAVAVIIAGIVVFVGYLIIKPKVPLISAASAQLDSLYFDITSLLTVQVSVVIKAENDNAKAHSSFYDMSFLLSFQGVKMAYLVAEPFDVNANRSVEFNYVTQSSPIPLNPEDAEAVNSSLKQKIITFDLKGRAKTRWRVGPIGSVKNWLHLDCKLHLPTDGTKIFPRCSSRSK
ncbi:Late [Abeliophyllum distichum]|uniref:Late n=1 Tax=Abeliophyllum distichum TaxID=126358 RepID=A0ABD1UJW7_9LAMI